MGGLEQFERVPETPAPQKLDRIEPSDVGKEAVELGPKAFDSPEGRCLEPDLRTDVPGCDEALVTGGPFEAAGTMDFEQGNNPFNAAGNCGLVSICNTLRRAGFDVTEDDVTKRAIDSGLCQYDPNGPASENGGTTLEMRRGVLALYGVDSEVCPAAGSGSLERIAEAIDGGHGVVISVCADLLWDKDLGGVGFFGPVSNHCVAVTGIARDAKTGEITGVYVADSGRGLESDACRYLSVETFHEVYTDVRGAGANITTEPLMGR